MKTQLKTVRFIAPALIAGLSLVSCLKSEFRYSGYVTFADVIDAATLRGDGDYIYNITENAADDKFKDMKRIVINCDLLTAAGSNSSQDIKLNAYQEIELKPCLISDNVDPIGCGADSLYVYRNSGYLTPNGDNTYLTVYLGIPKVKGSTATHIINAVFDTSSNAEELRYTISHDAGGDVYTKDTASDDRESDYRYFSFPVKEMLKDIAIGSNTRLTVKSAFQVKEDLSDAAGGDSDGTDGGDDTDGSGDDVSGASGE